MKQLHGADKVAQQLKDILIEQVKYFLQNTVLSQYLMNFVSQDKLKH